MEKKSLGSLWNRNCFLHQNHCYSIKLFTRVHSKQAKPGLCLNMALFFAAFPITIVIVLYKLFRYTRYRFKTIAIERVEIGTEAINVK